MERERERTDEKAWRESRRREGRRRRGWRRGEEGGRRREEVE